MDMSKPMDQAGPEQSLKAAGEPDLGDMPPEKQPAMPPGPAKDRGAMKKGHRMEGMPPDAETTPSPKKDMKTAGQSHEGHGAAERIDPVCGMETGGDENLSFTYKGTKYYFCSPEDMEKFKGDPAKYVK
jgi:YHS domain-containing protein